MNKNTNTDLHKNSFLIAFVTQLSLVSFSVINL